MVLIDETVRLTFYMVVPKKDIVLLFTFNSTTYVDGIKLYIIIMLFNLFIRLQHSNLLQYYN